MANIPRQCRGSRSPETHKSAYLLWVSAVTVASRRGLLAFPYHSGAPALKAVLGCSTLMDTAAEFESQTTADTRLPHSLALCTASHQFEIQSASAGSKDGGMGGFDAKLQGFAISPDDIQICLRDDGTGWLLVRC